jgi:hypothetical protein
MQISVQEDAGVLAGEVREWLTSGAIQPRSGAFCAWRDAATAQLAFEYPEITGYALTWVAGRDDPTRDELDAGVRAADWLSRRFAAGDRSARAGWDAGAVYTFDVGMIAAGLISFGHLVAADHYVDLGMRLARDLAAFITADGLPAIAPDGPATTRPPEWSTQGRPHLIKCVQALLLAGEHTAAGTLARTAARLQHSDGWFQTQPDDGYVMLHPHIYTIEGLWMWGAATGDFDALDRARAATEWAWAHQLPSGALPRFVSFGDEPEDAPEQLDVTSQAVRAAIMLGLSPSGLPRAVARLVEASRDSDHGGRALVYQPESGHEHHNAWVSMFGAQALEIETLGGAAMTWRTLV